MLDYAAPLKDMEFVIGELIGFQGINNLRGCEDITPDLCHAVLEEASRLAREELAPLNRKGDIEGSHLEGGIVRTPAGWKEAYQAFKEGGWSGLAVSSEYGGQGLPKVVASAVNEMWDSSNLSFALCPLLSAGAIEAIECHGNDQIKAMFLHKLVTGEWSGTMNLTEPQAGSDLSTVTTKAEPEGDHFRIKGTKIYITYGDHDLTENIIHLVLARLPGAPEGTKGISLFAVPKFLVKDDGSIGERNEVHCLSLEEKLGIHASPTAVMSYGEDKGAVGYLVGEENRGLMHMFTMMNNARHAVGREGLAISESAYQLALQYAMERKQGNVIGTATQATIVEHSDVKRMLMRMKALTEAMRGLTYTCAYAFDVAERATDEQECSRASRRGDLLTPVVKGWCTDNAQIVASLGVQIHGGMGFVEETGAAQYMRDARILPIYEGTNGIQALDLMGRKTLRDGGQAVSELFEDMENTLSRLGQLDLTNIETAFGESLGHLKEVLDWIKSNAGNNTLCNSAASHYLELMGITCGGWMLAKSAIVAADQLAQAPTDVKFYERKMITGDFYAQQVMPETGSLKDKIISGSQLISDMKLEAFA